MKQKTFFTIIEEGDYLHQGGYVFAGVYLSVSMSKVTPNVIDRL